MRVLDYLRSLNLDFKTSGKNIGSNWVGVKTCPHCSDSRYHFGVNIESGNFNCWVCGGTGSFAKLVQLLENISQFEAIQQVLEFSSSFTELEGENLATIVGEILSPNPLASVTAFRTNLALPKPLIPLSEAILRYPQLKYYFNSRGFLDSDMMEWESVGFCPDGKYAMRVIFPVKMDNQVVNFVARAIVPTTIRYLTCPNNQAILPITHCIYNIDNINLGDTFVICEGILDALKVQKLTPLKAVSVFSKRISNYQLLKIAKKQPKEVFLMLDGDAWVNGMEFKVKLESLISGRVTAILLNPDTDPGNLVSWESTKEATWI